MYKVEQIYIYIYFDKWAGEITEEQLCTRIIQGNNKTAPGN